MSASFVCAAAERANDPNRRHQQRRAHVSKAYLAEVLRRAEHAAQLEAAARSNPAAADAASASRLAFTLDVRDASSLGVAECRADYVARFRPLVISGLNPVTDPSPWTLPWLAEQCNAKRVAVNIGGSQTSAACSVAGVEVMTFAELQSRVESRADPRAYLYDCALPLKVPLLCERVGVPAYFAHDWLQRTRQLHAFSRSWPSLFVGSSGTRSSLHIDQWKVGRRRNWPWRDGELSGCLGLTLGLTLGCLRLIAEPTSGRLPQLADALACRLPAECLPSACRVLAECLPSACRLLADCLPSAGALLDGPAAGLQTLDHLPSGGRLVPGACLGYRGQSAPRANFPKS